MSCLIVQDGGLHYHCRTMDFRYADAVAARRGGQRAWPTR